MFVHNLNPVLINFGFIEIRWYSLAYIFGILIGWWLAKKIIIFKIKNNSLAYDLKKFDDLISIIILSIIVGGRIGYIVFYNLGYYLSNPIDIFKIWEGGMSFHGALIGIILGTYLFSKKNNINPFVNFDIIAAVAPIGIFLGRIANFINGELYGKPAEVPWSVIFPAIDQMPRHPSQLYEASLEGIVLFLILIILIFKNNIKTGICSGAFMFFYGLFRIISEQFREPDLQIGYLFNLLSMGTFLSIIMVLAGIYILINSKMQTPINKFFPKSKTLSLDKFIANALYNKKFGYYTQNIPFGKKGDFITSPEISGLFSEMLGVWIVALWEHLNKPKKFNIIELGPGSGKMSKDLISVFKKFPDFYKSSNLFLYEKSSLLKKVQQNKLKNEKVFWINSFKKINSGPVIFIGNEFFDAIPIKQFKRKNNILYEKYIRLEKEKQIKTFFRIINNNDINKLELIDYFKKSSFIEYPKQGFIELDKILKVIKKLKGGLLLIDYGFLNSKNKNTLQSIKDHKKNHIFKNVGNADITSLVNFDLLKTFLEHRGLKSNEVITQGFFLKKLGILFRADNLGRNLSFKQKSDLYYRIQRLINPKQMGELFKVIFAFKLDKKFTLGFY